MTVISEQLRELAAAEETLTMPSPQSWPEYAERTYHVGRQSAFLQAARLVETEPQSPAATCHEPSPFHDRRPS